jgi:hypothetical protein
VKGLDSGCFREGDEHVLIKIEEVSEDQRRLRIQELRRFLHVISLALLHEVDLNGILTPNDVI